MSAVATPPSACHRQVLLQGAFLLAWLWLTLPGLAQDAPKSLPPPIRWQGFTEPGKYLTALAPDGQGGVWCGAEKQGLWHFDGLYWRPEVIPVKTAEEIHFYLPSTAPIMEYPTALLKTAEGLWVGLSRSGLMFRSADGKWEQYDLYSGLAAQRISVLYQDQRGRVWLGSESGLWQWYNSLWVFEGAAAGELITAITEWDGAIVVGTANRGLWRNTPKGLVPWTTAELPDPRVETLLATPDQRLWVGTMAGLVTYEGTTWRPIKLPWPKRTAAQERTAETPDSSAILDLAPDPAGNLWLATRAKGLWRYTPTTDKWLAVTRAQGLTDDFLRRVTVAPEGTVWSASYGGGLYQGELATRSWPVADTTLTWANGALHCGATWSVGELLGKSAPKGSRPLLMHSDQAKTAVAVYWQAPPAATKPGVKPASPPGGVVVLDLASGRELWRRDLLPAGPLAWSAEAALVAALVSPTSLGIWRPGQLDPQLITLPQASLAVNYLPDGVFRIRQVDHRSYHLWLHDTPEARVRRRLFYRTGQLLPPLANESPTP